MGFYSPEVADRRCAAARRDGAAAGRERECGWLHAGAREKGGKGARERLRPPLLSHLRSSAASRLRYLHGLGEAGIERVLAASGEQPFASLGDFCRRTRLPRPLIGDLIRAGALDSCQAPQPAAERSTRSADGRRRLLWQLGETQYAEEQLVEAPVSEADLPELSEGEAFAWDYELLGVTPGDHPLRLWRPRLQQQGVLSRSRAQPAARRPARPGRRAGRRAPGAADGQRASLHHAGGRDRAGQPDHPA